VVDPLGTLLVEPEEVTRQPLAGMPIHQVKPDGESSNPFKRDSEFQLLGADCNSRSLIISIQNRNSKLDAENISLQRSLTALRAGKTAKQLEVAKLHGDHVLLLRAHESLRLQARAEVCFLREQCLRLTSRNNFLEIRSLGPTPFIFGDSRDSLPGTQGTGWLPSRRFPVKPKNFDMLLPIARERALMRSRREAKNRGLPMPEDLPPAWIPEIPPPSKDEVSQWIFQGKEVSYEELMTILRQRAKLSGPNP
jgi:hypothetical protein